MKILHFGFILYLPQEMVGGLREIGEEADHGVWDFCNSEWLSKETDYNLNLYHIMETLTPFEQVLGKIVGLWYRYIFSDPTHNANDIHLPTIQNYRSFKMLIRALLQYHVIHFHSIPSFFLPESKNMRRVESCLFRLFRKKIFISFWGCDIRSEKIDLAYPWSPCEICPDLLKSFCNDSEKTKKLECSRKLCNRIFSSGDLCVAFTDFVWMDNPVDTTERKPLKMEEIPAEFQLPRGEKIYIYHSVGNASIRNDVKGSAYVLESIDALKNEGYNVELRYFSTVPNNILYYYQNQADIVIDQLKGGFYGQTAVECMAVGKPVVCYLREDIKKRCPHKDLPIVEANPVNIKDVLRKLIESPELRKTLGEKSREYVIKHHDRKEVAKNLLAYYKKC